MRNTIAFGLLALIFFFGITGFVLLSALTGIGFFIASLIPAWRDSYEEVNHGTEV